MTTNAQSMRPAPGRTSDGLAESVALLCSPETEVILGLIFSADCTRLAASKSSSRIEIWDLKLIRLELAGMRLDWDALPFSDDGGARGN